MRFWRPEGCSELIYLTHAACQSFVDPFHLSSFDFPFSFAVVFSVPFVPRTLTSLSCLFSEKILLISRYHRTQCTFVSLAQIIMSSRIPTKQPFTAALFQHQGIIIRRQCHACFTVIGASPFFVSSSWRAGVEFSLVPVLFGRLPVVRSQADSGKLFIRIIIEARDWFLSHLGS